MTVPMQSPLAVLASYGNAIDRIAQLKAELAQLETKSEADLSLLEALFPEGTRQHFYNGNPCSGRAWYVYHSCAGLSIESVELKSPVELEWPEPTEREIREALAPDLSALLEARGSTGKPEDEDDVIDPAFEPVRRYGDNTEEFSGPFDLSPSVALIDAEAS
jgi:hypothetical protein